MKKIALLSNVNIDPLENYLNVDSLYSLYFGGYNQWQTELVKPDSGLSAFKPDLVFIYLNAELLKSYHADLFSSVEIFNNYQPDTQFIIANISLPPYRITTYLNDFNFFDKQINEDLVALATDKKNIFILDFNRLINFHGYDSLFDEKYWYIGGIKLSGKGFKILANELKNLLKAILGETKKLLIVDLDNTLWGGIVGEDGWKNLQLSDQGIGQIYVDFQKKLKILSKHGILLATCSKNNEQDVREVFKSNKNMQLDWDDFVIHKINWQQKSQNVLEIASKLNIGLDSIVLIDDNPVERELLINNIPELTVPEFPADISRLNRWFITDVVYPYFSKVNLTTDDVDKANQYKRNFKRELEKVKLNFDDFIRQLDIRINVNQLDQDASFQRVAQLAQKTNQFNLSLKRYTENDINKHVREESYLVFTCTYEDKFGYEGVVGCAIIQLDGKKAIIDSFMMSCRVLCRNVEFEFLSKIIDKLKELEVLEIEALYCPTKKNKMVADFFKTFGFEMRNNNLYIKQI